LAVKSTHFTSRLAAQSLLPTDPVIMRSAASRFSRPQQAYTPAQCDGTNRRYDATEGAPSAKSADSRFKMPALNASPTGASP
jgi:hypothetical protein